MKNVGVFLIAVGLALMLFLGYSFIKNQNQLKSPLPEEGGVKVIFVTPTK